MPKIGLPGGSLSSLLISSATIEFSPGEKWMERFSNFLVILPPSLSSSPPLWNN